MSQIMFVICDIDLPFAMYLLSMDQFTRETLFKVKCVVLVRLIIQMGEDTKAIFLTINMKVKESF